VKAAFALFAAGAGLLFPFEHAVTLAAGVLLLLASIVVGAFAIASPEHLAGDD
jgi:hypothetical protein